VEAAEHETRNVGAGIARVASTFIVDKDKPMLQRLEKDAN
jgi:hypothetical protein